ncbi:adenylyl-sulfate kinase [Ensifer soli]|uniref:adenylyl-sulfate kinase n=1 Tax=Ciceribacter sp. sgz301302 TaxID=3342379 RepID=UPI0035BADAA3
MRVELFSFRPDTFAAAERDGRDLVRILACGGDPPILPAGAPGAAGPLGAAVVVTGARRIALVAGLPGGSVSTADFAVAAADADALLLSLDAARGLGPEGRRRAGLAALLGVRHLLLAVTGIGGTSADHLRRARDEAGRLAGTLGFCSVTALPASDGGPAWQDGQDVRDWLDGLPPAVDAGGAPFRLPVQLVLAPRPDMQAFAGTVAAGAVAVGDAVVVAQSGQIARVAEILVAGVPRRSASAGDAVVLRLSETVAVVRGSMLAAVAARPEVAGELEAMLVWTDADPLSPGRSFRLETEVDATLAVVTAIRARRDPSTGESLPATALSQGEIGAAELRLQAPIAFDPHAVIRATGRFRLVEPASGRTVGLGMIERALRLSTNIHQQHFEIGKAERAALKRQKPCVVWLTGLSGSGKSTTANALDKLLLAAGHHAVLIDGDNVRHGLNRDLGFTAADRAENIRRVGEVARLMVDAGLIAIVSTISPGQAERDAARALVAPDEFVEVFVDTPLAVCIERDHKGLYRRAIAGELKNFTGISAAYDRPPAPELRIEAVGRTPEAAALAILSYLRDTGRLP